MESISRSLFKPRRISCGLAGLANLTVAVLQRGMQKLFDFCGDAGRSFHGDIRQQLVTRFDLNSCGTHVKVFDADGFDVECFDVDVSVY